MHSFESESTIAASPAEVWAVLSRASEWPDWDSGVDAVEGTVGPGAKVTVRSHVAPTRAFPVKVTEFAPSRSMVFTGGMPLGLFRGVRTYTVTPVDSGSTKFTMREEYSGPLLGMIGKSIPDLSDSFRQFAEGLKGRVERGA
ncbi:hypothetical protein BH10ACT4_BH10ACT4_01370 [soil metagenome]